MKILVTGGRDFDQADVVNQTLDELHAQTPITLLVHGAAKGADRLAAAWAATNGVPEHASKPNYGRYGRGAGLKNNDDMLATQPDLVVAFPGGKGTADMVRRARNAGLKVQQVIAE